jgi:hypothetical protein
MSGDLWKGTHMKRFTIFLLLSPIAACLIQAQTVSCEELVYRGRTYPLYPDVLDERPEMPSPLTASDGSEYVVGLTEEGNFTIFQVTVGNDEKLNYKENMWYGKGRQLDVDSSDFPTLAATGLHSEEELRQTGTITGRPVEEITRIGRPEQYSGVGFMADDEDILSVLMGDNRLVRRMGLTHPELARPLFHVFNVIQTVMSRSGFEKRGDAQGILYNGRVVNLKFWGAKGWQESIFDDEILGYWQIEMSRELDSVETALLTGKYPNVLEETRSRMIRHLSYVHTGEMVPFYIGRYGFYEGHRGYRADPIAIASVFGLRSIEELEDIFDGELHLALLKHHVSGDADN